MTKNFKKMFLNTGAILAAVSPVAAVIACSEEKNLKETMNEIIEGITTSLPDKVTIDLTGNESLDGDGKLTQTEYDALEDEIISEAIKAVKDSAEYEALTDDEKTLIDGLLIVEENYEREEIHDDHIHTLFKIYDVEYEIKIHITGI